MSEDVLPEEFFEKFPEPAVRNRLSRIWENILKSWGSQEGIDYLNSLLIVEEDRSRQGFDSGVMSELLLLEKIHVLKFPEFPPSTLDTGYDFADGLKPLADY